MDSAFFFLGSRIFEKNVKIKHARETQPKFFLIPHDCKSLKPLGKTL